MKPIFVDTVPRWVPIVSAVLIVAGVWFGANVSHFEPQVSVSLAIGLAGALLVLVFFQGRYYWRGQIAELSSDGMRYEARTTVWLGPGRRLAFAATEAKSWTAKAGAPGGNGTVDAPSAIRFQLRGEPMELSLVNPKRLDLESLSALNPAYFQKLRADYPRLKSIGK